MDRSNLVSQQFKVIIIGSGFGGQLAAINLAKQGITDFLIIERRDFMGGTWCQNAYPGAAVDVPSTLYSLSSEPYDWTQMYAAQDELQSYTEHVIKKHGLKEKTQTATNVTQIAWDEDAQLWTVDTSALNYRAQFVINASGPLSTPVIPEFEGRKRFKGKAFHSNNWDNDYDYKGKRVAVIGSGASAAQIIPAIVDDVQSLDIFQRTPHWVIPRHDYVFKSWQRKLLRKKWFYYLLRNIVYWALEYRVIGFKYSQKVLNLIGRGDGFKLMRKQIADPELRAKVVPDFSFGCKRVILSDTLYPAYCKPQVSFHDKNNAIKQISEQGIISQDGVEHELDLIVYATGYDATDGVISYPVLGKGGQSLKETWCDYPRAYLGTTIPEFPNLFIVTGPNTGIGHTSAIFLIEAQMNYIMASIDAVNQSGKRVVEVKAEAEQAYTSWVHKAMQRTVWQSGGCNSWYKSKSGKVIAMFPGFSFTFRRWTKGFKIKDHLLYGDTGKD